MGDGTPTGPVVIYQRHAQQLHHGRLDVSALDWEEGLALCAERGLDQPDRIRCTYAFLYRLTPYWRVVNGWMASDVMPPMERFPGWGRLRLELISECRGMDTAERWHFLQVAFGGDGARMAAVLLAT